MTYDLINTFKEYLKNDSVVLGTYKMNDGYYYLIKKDGTMDRLIVKNNNSDNYELYEYLKIRDFYSKYVNYDKVICTSFTENIENKKYKMAKKICSNNIYTLFLKNKNVIGLCSEQSQNDAVPIDVFKKGIDKYYQSLKKLGEKKEEKELLKKFYDEKEIEESKIKILQGFEKVYDDFLKEEKPKEIWIKIFLEETEEEYKRVGNIYFTLKLFNTNKNNKKLDNIVYGVNNYNYGLNSKKPYLQLKSTPYKIGSMVSEQEIIILNNLYLWLYNNGVRHNLLKLVSDFKFNGVSNDKDNIQNKDLYIINVKHDKKKDKTKIDDFQYVTNFSTNIREFICKDYINKKENTFITENIYRLEGYTNNVWIAENLNSETNYLKDSYYDYETKISNWKKEILRNYSNVFLDLFQKEDEMNFISNINKIATKIVQNIMIEQFEKGKKYKFSSINAINLWIAYKIYFNKKGEDIEMKFNNIQETCKKIFTENGKIETDEQYYYFAGQIAFYLLNQSKATKLTQDITSPFIKAMNLKKLKEELKFLYEKYNYGIYLNYPKFNNILSQLLLQEPETNVKDNKDIILAGMLADNLFYTEKEKNGGNENGENE